MPVGSQPIQIAGVAAAQRGGGANLQRPDGSDPEHPAGKAELRTGLNTIYILRSQM